ARERARAEHDRLATGRHAIAAAARPALLVGDPAYPPTGRWTRLDGAAAEIQDIAHRSPGATTLTGPAARPTRLREWAASGELARFGVLHFATHAEVDPRRVLESALVLAPDTIGGSVSSRLMAREIAARWRLDADLVSLATCRSVQGLGSAT